MKSEYIAMLLKDTQEVYQSYCDGKIKAENAVSVIRVNRANDLPLTLMDNVDNVIEAYVNLIRYEYKR